VSQGVDVRRLEHRLGAVHAVGAIVHAIWALSRAQLAQVDALAREASAYLDWVDDVVHRLAGEPVANAGIEPLLVVMGPERAFCGGLAQRVVRALQPRVRRGAALGVVGQRLAEHVAARAELAGRVLFRVPAPSSVDDIMDAARGVAAHVLAHGGGRQVELCYPLAGRSALARVVLLSGERVARSFAEFETFSEPSRVLHAAVAESVVGHVRVGLAEALRAEVQARAMAAELARHAVDRQRDELQAALRLLEQEGITNELGELYAGRLVREVP
jgi:F0F1-type ATP synthase gamma subunit